MVGACSEPFAIQAGNVDGSGSRTVSGSPRVVGACGVTASKCGAYSFGTYFLACSVILAGSFPCLASRVVVLVISSH
jgi:hypothetical protein